MANLLWIQGICCGGETASLLNSDHPYLQAALRQGLVETALVGTPVPGPERPTMMSHVVKSFDPCLFCTVH